MTRKKSYAVGFGKPPVETQFKKGVSGNPKGRPKGSLNTATVLERTLRELVVINENGRRKTITKLEAAFKQLANQAAGGNLRAVHMLVPFALAIEERSLEKVGNFESDQQVIANILMRFERRSQNRGATNVE